MAGPVGEPGRRLSGRPLDLLAVGHVNLDRFLWLAEWPAEDRTVPLERQTLELGGTAANLALAAASFGVRVGVASRVGADFPREFRERLRTSGVDLTDLVHVPGATSPTCFIVEDGRGHQRTMIDQGPMGDRPHAPARLPDLRRSSWVHLGTGPPDWILSIAERASRTGTRVSADPAQELRYRWSARPFRALLQRSEILFGNAAEVAHARRLLGYRSTEGLLDLVPLVVETRGSVGALGVARGETVAVPAHRPRRVRQVTGAGDAFRAGFYAGWFAGVPLTDCLEAGTRSAAAWMERGGPPPPARTRSETGRRRGAARGGRDR